MFYNIFLKIKDCPSSYLGMALGRFISNAPNRNCVVWLDNFSKAERIVKILRKRWDITKIEIQSYERILK